MNNALIIFIKNPVPGKVKTRLAKSMSDREALEVYNYLLSYTRNVALEVKSTEWYLFYSDFIDGNDHWQNQKFNKKLQTPNADLGRRMEKAFESVFRKGYDKAVIIGSDCLEITPNHINEAFQKLDDSDVVIGPATDGGYYLLGMKKPIPALFRNKHWSTASVFQDTINDMERLNLKYEQLPVLSDIDEEQDLKLPVYGNQSVTSGRTL